MLELNRDRLPNWQMYLSYTMSYVHAIGPKNGSGGGTRTTRPPEYGSGELPPAPPRGKNGAPCRARTGNRQIDNLVHWPIVLKVL